MKHILKFVMSWCCRILILPLLAILRLMEIFIHTDQPFQFGAHAVSLIPGFLGNYFRKEYYRLTLKRCGADICVEFGTILNQASVELGRHVYIGTRCSIGECIIEDDAIIGSNVDIISGKNQHNFGKLDISLREQGGRLKKIVIGPDCWIGNSAVVMADVGERSIVGAGSVVVENIEPYAIVAGNPARLLRKRPGYVRKVSKA
jgi:virginiamycin A acetyltransferase